WSKSECPTPVNARDRCRLLGTSVGGPLTLRRNCGSPQTPANEQIGEDEMTAGRWLAPILASCMLAMAACSKSNSEASTAPPSQTTTGAATAGPNAVAVSLQH